MNSRILFFVQLLLLYITLNTQSFSQYSIVDTSLITKLVSQADSILNNDTKAAQKFVDSASAISNQINLKEYQMRILQTQAMIYYNRGRYNKSLKNLETLREYFETINDTLKLATIYNDLGLINSEMSNFTLALKYLHKAYRTRGEKGSVKERAITWGNIGLTYIYMGKYEEAREYLTEALNHFKVIDFKEGIATINGNLGMSYERAGNYNEAIKYHEIAIDIYRTISNKDGIANELNNIGLLKYYEEKYYEAIQYFKKSLNMREELDDINGQLFPLNNIAHVYRQQKNYKEALKYLNKSLSIADNSNDKRIMLLILEKTALVYSDLKDFVNAYDYQIKYQKLYEEIFNTEKNEQIEELKVEFETEQKEAEIINLKNINEQRNLIIILLTSIFALLGVLTYLGITKYKLKTVQNSIELEQRLLRSQMNPHFIFNSLSVIQGYILKEKSQIAVSYLSNFGSLMRNILESSSEEYVSIEKEVETIKDYLLLQNLRNDGKIVYSVELSENTLAEAISIPPMFAQPFIENSIKHGMQPDNKLSIYIKFEKILDKIKLTIVDDGIGIDSAKENKKNADDHKSRAISIANSRLNLLGKKNKSKYKLTIVDLGKTSSNISGTKVEIEMPFIEEF